MKRHNYIDVTTGFILGAIALACIMLMLGAFNERALERCMQVQSADVCWNSIK